MFPVKLSHLLTFNFFSISFKSKASASLGRLLKLLAKIAKYSCLSSLCHLTSSAFSTNLLSIDTPSTLSFHLISPKKIFLWLSIATRSISVSFFHHGPILLKVNGTNFSAIENTDGSEETKYGNSSITITNFSLPLYHWVMKSKALIQESKRTSIPVKF